MSYVSSNSWREQQPKTTKQQNNKMSVNMLDTCFTQLWDIYAGGEGEEL